MSKIDELAALIKPKPFGFTDEYWQEKIKPVSKAIETAIDERVGKVRAQVESLELLRTTISENTIAIGRLEGRVDMSLGIEED